MSRFLNCALSPESLAVMGRELDGMFEQLFGGTRTGDESGGSESRRILRAQSIVWEQEDKLFAQIELPGVRKEDVSITLENGMLEITAEKRGVELGEHKLWHNSIVTGQYRHRVSVGEKFNADTVEASMADGVLSIRMQKKPEVQPRKVQIS